MIQRYKPNIYKRQINNNNNFNGSFDQGFNQLNNINNNDNNILLNASFLHANIYPKILEDLRVTMIDNMAKPNEVLVVIDENGDAVEEVFDDV